MVGWNIVRHGPIGRVYGRAFPTFIRNGHRHFLHRIKVYADGLVSSSIGYDDLDLFRRGKLSGPPVSPRPPVGCVVSLLDLGTATVAEADWSVSWEDIVAQVEQAVRELNPEMRGLVDLHGDAFHRDGGNVAKLGLGLDWPYRLTVSGEEIRGEEVPVFLREGKTSRLSNWIVYADGQSQIQSFGTIPLRQTTRMMEEGELSTSLPDGTWVNVDGLGRFRATDCDWRVKPLERIRECLDLVEVANGRAGSTHTCRLRHEEYQADPTAERRELLRLAYEAVPEHLRRFCGDMGVGDRVIRRTIYGEQKV